MHAFLFFGLLIQLVPLYVYFGLRLNYLQCNLKFTFIKADIKINRIMLLKQRKNMHKKNISSALGTGRSKRTSQQKSKSKQHKQGTQRQRQSRQKSGEKTKSKPKVNQYQLLKRMSFQSPNKKDDSNCSKNFSLLNYMIFKQKQLKGGAMGTISQHEHANHKQKMSKDLFTVLEVLGKGGFSRVMKVEFKKNKKIYAMKEMSKAVIITKKSRESVQNERKLLQQLRHPFLVNMIYAFQDRQNLYLIMDLMPGGDLRYQMGRYGTFPQKIVKFFVCCIIVGLQYLHMNNIIHRDIKPENLVIDEKGYLRITDLGVAKAKVDQNYQDTSGTPGYMAPQVINRKNHGFAVDFFALGVIAYECMLGRRPYRGYNRQEIRQQMLLYEANIKPHQIPQSWSLQSANFINRTLKRRQQQRLGYNSIQQLKEHPWLKDINWQNFVGKKFPSPFIPNFQQRNYDTVSVSQYGEDYLERLNQNQLAIRNEQVNAIFQGYQYEQVKFL